MTVTSSINRLRNNVHEHLLILPKKSFHSLLSAKINMNAEIRGTQYTFTPALPTTPFQQQHLANILFNLSILSILPFRCSLCCLFVLPSLAFPSFLSLYYTFHPIYPLTYLSRTTSIVKSYMDTACDASTAKSTSSPIFFLG